MNLSSMKVTLKEKIGYATGDFASNLFWQPFTIFLLYYYTDIFGISAAAIGTMFLVTRIWDTFFDPIVGLIADRTNTKWGKFRPYILWMALPFGIIGSITYLAPDLSQSGKLIFAYLTYTLMMMIYSAINVPYSALLGVISPNPHERESVSSYKFTFAFLAGIIVQALTLFMVDYIGKDDSKIINANLKDNVLTINEVKNGSAKIIVKAEDDKGAKKDFTFYVKVYKKNATPPVIKKNIASDTIFEDTIEKEYNLYEYFENTENKPLKFEVQSDNKKVADTEIVGNKLLIKQRNKGIATISIDASNSVGTVRSNFSILVTTRNNKFPLLVSPLPNIELTRGFKKHTINLNGIFNDPDKQKLSFFATSSDIQVCGIVTSNDKITISEVGQGKSNIIIYAYDGVGGVATDTITVSIKEKENSAPIVEKSISNLNLTAGFGSEQINLSEIFHDPDGDKITLSVTCVNESKGYFNTMTIFAVLAVIMFFFTFFSTHERVQPISEQKSSLADDLKDLINNRPWLILFALSIFLQIYVAIRQSSIIYYFKYYVGNTNLSAAYLVAGTIASLAGAFLIQYVTKKHGKKSTFLTLLGMGTFFTILTFWVKPDQYIPMFGLQIILQFFTGPLSPVLWAMYTDSADYSEWKTGRRATGLILSASVFSLKFGWAIGSAITGWLLAYFGFQANIIQNIEAQTGIRMLISIIPSISLIIGGIVFLFYRLDRSTIAQMTAELHNRRNNNSQ